MRFIHLLIVAMKLHRSVCPMGRVVDEWHIWFTV